MRRVLILGASGRDYHVFNTFFRLNPSYKVVAFAVTQIPGVGSRRYPPSLAGPNYPDGIPIYELNNVEELSDLIRRFNVDDVVLAYSDLLYDDVGEIISVVLSSGASFRILGPNDTYLNSIKPVIAVTATRTGAGKSTVSREVLKELLSRGVKAVVVRHPMAYGDLERGKLQELRRREELASLSFEEREEYEHYVDLGVTVLAGVDYGLVIRRAEELGDIILWDGGNNDFPFFRPNYLIVVTDARRPGHEVKSFPGEVNLRMADAVVITKVSESTREAVDRIVSNVRMRNRRAEIIKADLVVTVDDPSKIAGRKALIIEDSPTVTHGGLPYGAGYLAAVKYGAEIVDPRNYAVGEVKRVYEEYAHIGPVLPSLGYTERQKADLEETIRRVPADVVVLGTPARIEEVVRIDKPVVRVRWSLKIVEGPSIADLVNAFLEKCGLAPHR